MLKKVVVVVMIGCVVASGFIGASLVQLYKLNTLLNKELANKLLEINKNSKIEFSRAKPIIKFNKVGIKFEGVNEANSIRVIKFKNPIKIYMDPWNFKLITSYNGEVIAEKFKNKDIIEAVGDVKIVGNFEWNANLLKVLIQQRNFEAINYLKDIAINIAFLKINYEKKYQEIIELNNTNIDLKIDKHRYYTNKLELLEDLPKLYIINSKINSYSSDNEKKFALNNVLGFQGEIDVKIHVNTPKFSSQQTVEEFVIELATNNIENDSGLSSTTGVIKISPYKAMDLKISTRQKFKPALVEKLINIVRIVSRNLPSALKLKDYDIIRNFIPPIDYDQELYSNIDLSYHQAQDDRMDITLNNWSIRNNNTGVAITGTGEGNSDITNLKADLNIVLSNYPALVNYWQQHFYNIFGNNIPKELFQFKNENLKEFLKIVSDYPASTSNDLSFHTEWDSKQNKFLIANKQLQKLLEIYEQVKLMKALKLSAKAKDPNAKLNELIPETKENLQDLLEYLPKDFEIPSEFQETLTK